MRPASCDPAVVLEVAGASDPRGHGQDGGLGTRAGQGIRAVGIARGA